MFLETQNIALKYIKQMLNSYVASIYSVWQFRFHRGVFQLKHLEHLCPNLSYSFPVALTIQASLKTENSSNGVKAKIGTRTLYSNTVHLKGKEGVGRTCQGHTAQLPAVDLGSMFH